MATTINTHTTPLSGGRSLTITKEVKTQFGTPETKVLSRQLIDADGRTHDLDGPEYAALLAEG